MKKKPTPPPYVPPARGGRPTPSPSVPPIQSGPVQVMPNGPFGVGGRNRGEPVPPIQSGPASNFKSPKNFPKETNVYDLSPEAVKII